MSNFPVHIQSSWRKKVNMNSKRLLLAIKHFLIEERKQFEVYPKRIIYLKRLIKHHLKK